MEEATCNGPLRAVTNSQLGELGPPGQLAGDDARSRSALHNDPAGHEIAGFVTTPSQQLLDSAPVSFELGHQQDGGVLLVPSVARRHPQLVELVEGVLAERSHKRVGLAGALLARSAVQADRILGPSHGPPPRGADRLPRNV